MVHSELGLLVDALSDRFTLSAVCIMLPFNNGNRRGLLAFFSAGPSSHGRWSGQPDGKAGGGRRRVEETSALVNQSIIRRLASSRRSKVCLCLGVP